jgi:hypothetical protein
MPRNFKTQLAGQIGEHLVVAELGRRGVVATPFSGNVTAKGIEEQMVKLGKRNHV